MFSFGSRFSVQTALCSLWMLGMAHGLSLPSALGLGSALSDPTDAVSSTDTPSDTMAMASLNDSGITADFQFSYNPTSSTTRIIVVVTGLTDGFNNPYHSG
jgi:hypothetical protein